MIGAERVLDGDYEQDGGAFMTTMRDRAGAECLHSPHPKQIFELQLTGRLQARKERRTRCRMEVRAGSWDRIRSASSRVWEGR